jgi:hypothetical protein
MKAYHSFILLVIILIPNMIIPCPYCAGQSGENYIQQIIIPIGALLVAPFIVVGTVVLIVYFNQKNIG